MTQNALYAIPHTDEEMRQFGFRDCGSRWYYYRAIDYPITYNVTIDKETHELKIEVLDEMFGQYYDYAYLLSRSYTNLVAICVQNEAILETQRLLSLGLIDIDTYSQWYKAETCFICHN